MLPAQVDVLILGAGIAGAATAWYLHHERTRDVLVIEREAAPGQQASGRNAAILRVPDAPPLLKAWAAASRSVLRSLGVVRDTGGLLVGPGDDAPPPDHPLAALRGRLVPNGGSIDVPRLLSIYLEGTRVFAGVDAEPPVARDGGFTVPTSAGPIHARVVVNATGAWAGRFGAGPLQPTRRHVAISAPDPRVRDEWPWVWDLASAWYARPWSGAWLLCVGDETPVDADDDPSPDPDVIARIESQFATLLDPLPTPHLTRSWTGHRTFAPDRMPRVHEDAQRSGLVHVAALGGHGITLSPAIGAVAASIVRSILERNSAPTN